MKLAVIGSRSFDDYELLDRTMRKYFHSPEVILSGGARGADQLAVKWAENYKIPALEFFPDWKKHGRSAGFMRNIDIVSNADFVLAFWDGTSKGTAHSLNLAKKAKKPTMVIYY